MGNLTMVTVLPQFPAMTYNTAFCILLSSFSIIGRILNKSHLSIGTSSVSFFITSIVMLEYIFGIDLPSFDHMFIDPSTLIKPTTLYPGRISPNAAFGLLLINASIILSNYLMSYYRIAVVMLFFNCCAVGISMVALVGYTFDMSTAYSWNGLPSMSIPSALGIIILAVSHTIFISMTEDSLHISSIGTIFLGVTMSFLISHGVYNDQRIIFQERLDQSALEISNNIQNILKGNIDSLSRMAYRWQIGRGTPDNVWLTDAAQYVKSLPGLSCIQKLSPTFQVEKSSANCANPLSSSSSNIDTLFLEATEYFKNNTDPFVSKIIVTATGEKYFIILNALTNRGAADGYFFSLISLSRFLPESALNASSKNFLMTIFEGESPIYTLNKKLSDEIVHNISGRSIISNGIVNWTLYIFPTAEKYNTFISALPFKIFFVGLFLSLVLSYAIYLRFQAHQRSKQLENMNINLKESESHLADYSQQLKQQVAKITESQKVLEDKTKSLKQLSNSLRRLADENAQALTLAEEEHYKAVKASATKTRFLNHINHEIRTPLSSIVGFAEMIREESYGPIMPKEYVRYVNYIYDSSKKLTEIVDDFLSYSTIESGKMERHPKLIAPQKLITTAISDVNAMADEKNIIIHHHVPEDIDPLYADPGQMKQILLNLLTNAIKYSPPNREIFILCHLSENKEFEITVQDTGNGIDPQYIDKIFDPIGEIHKTSDGSEQGSGLGMFLIKSYVELNGGTIHIKSKVGVGTNIKLTFPPAPQNLKANMNAAEDFANKKIVLPPLKILAAEDNQTNQLFLQALLESNGHQVSFVCNGKQALETVKTEYFDLVLMDLQMPEMLGDEATREIRLLPSMAAKIPIIALTASTSAADKERILSAGMNGYLTKPVRQEMLLSEIKRCLSL